MNERDREIKKQETEKGTEKEKKRKKETRKGKWGKGEASSQKQGEVGDKTTPSFKLFVSPSSPEASGGALFPC